MRKNEYYWNIDKCREEALKYQNKTDFEKYSSYIYEKSRKNNWLKEICSHMIKKEKWTKDKCKQEALKFNSRKEFRKKSGSAYNKSLTMKWMDEICSHMYQFKKEKDFWTKEKCHEEALKYSTRYDYCKKSSGSYSKAWEKNWLDEICSHMFIVGNKYKRCIYVYEFEETKTSYVGLTYDIKNRNEQHLKRGPVFEYSKINNCSPIMKQLTNYLDVNEAKIKEDFFLNEYINNGWSVLNKSKTGAIGGGTRKWTKEKCIVDAKSYTSKKDYCDSKGYRAAVRNKWLNDIYKECNF